MTAFRHHILTSLLTVVLITFLGGLLHGCGKRQEQNHASVSAGYPSGADTEKSATPSRPPLRFRSEVCVDRQGTGIEAFRMLVPSDWSFEGGVTWLLDNPGMPASGWLRTTGPRAGEAIELFPNQSFFWTDNPMHRQMFPAGSKYFGAEVRQPVSALDMLKSIVLRRFRKQAEDLSVVRAERLPDLAASLGIKVGQDGIGRSDGGRIRLAYGRDGIRLEEEVYGVIKSYGFPIQSMYGTFTNTFWTGEFLIAMTAPAGTLDSMGTLYRTMVTSIRVNPEWLSRYAQVVDYLIQNQMRAIRSAGELSRIISRTHSEISDDMMRSWEGRQAVYDRLSESFSQNIRGVDEYYDPVNGRPVELPAGYRNAWVNGLGEYVIADQEDFNPNIGSNQNWQRMERK